ncbi:MAG: hypothetical protein H5T86_08785 [Armatimonadetes bacterium]|nr:hypothetical protein [Armatimonadota bacterium]
MKARRQDNTGDGPAFLSQAPWIRGYGPRIVNSLVRAGCRTVGDILRLDPDDFGRVRGVGAVQVRLLVEIQRWLRIARFADRGASVSVIHSDAASKRNPAYRLLEELPWLEEYGWRIINSLLRAGVRNASELAELSPDEFAAVRGVGAKQVAQLQEIQRRLQRVPPRSRKLVSAAQRQRHDSVSEKRASKRQGRGEREAGDKSWRPGSLSEALQRLSLYPPGGLSRRSAEEWMRLLLGMHKPFAELRDALSRVFARCLGAVTIADAACLLAAEMDWDEVPTEDEMRAFLRLVPDDPLQLRYCSHSPVVRSGQSCEALWLAALEVASHYLNAAVEDRPLSELAMHLSARLSQRCWAHANRDTTVIPCCGAKTGKVHIPIEYARCALLEADPTALDGEIVLGIWKRTLYHGRARPSVVRAAIELIGRPAHFREIAEFVRAHSTRYRNLTDEDVLRLLRQRPEFVMTAELGVYGLAEWAVGAARRVPLSLIRKWIAEILAEHGGSAMVAEVKRVLRENGIRGKRVDAALESEMFDLKPDGTMTLGRFAASSVPTADRTERVAGIETQREIDILELPDDEEDSWL